MNKPKCQIIDRRKLVTNHATKSQLTSYTHIAHKVRTDEILANARTRYTVTDKQLLDRTIIPEMIITDDGTQRIETLPETIARYNLHVAYARHIINVLAGMMVWNGRYDENGTKVFVPSKNCTPCQTIINNGFRDTIVSDIEQEIYISLFDMVNNGAVSLVDDRINFSTYITKDGREKSYFCKLYQTVQSILMNNKNHSSNGETVIPIDSFITSEDGNERVISRENNSYLKSVGYDGGTFDIFKRDDFQNISHAIACRVKNANRRARIYDVLCGLIRGYSQDEIARKYRHAIASIKRDIALLREVYTDWKKDGNSFDVRTSEPVFYGTMTDTHSYCHKITFNHPANVTKKRIIKKRAMIRTDAHELEKHESAYNHINARHGFVCARDILTDDTIDGIIRTICAENVIIPVSNNTRYEKSAFLDTMNRLSCNHGFVCADDILTDYTRAGILASVK